MPTPDKHALLSPSASERWLHCTRALRLEETMPESTSAYAEEGRLAHAIAELKAQKKFTPMSARAYNSAMKKLEADPMYQKEMQEHTDLYIEQLTEAAMAYSTVPVVALETVVNFSDYAPPEAKDDAFGTSDCIMVGGDTITVCDFKYGQGVPVSAEHNSQMMLYALGALALYKPFYGSLITRVRMMISQPRIRNFSTWEISRDELERWGREVVLPAATLAYAGEGEFCPGEDTCRFCRVKHTCAARSYKYLALEAFKDSAAIPGSLAADLIAVGNTHDVEGMPPLLTDREVGDILVSARGLAAWLRDLEDYALTACLAGKEITGWKAVEGRGSREWADLDAALAALPERGIDAALLYERKPVSPAALEKTLGKKLYGESVEDLVRKLPGKPTLAAESDKRPPYNPAAAAFGDSN